ncbi:MAG TPA: copper homeostasis protein CutC [Bacteroidia bacterium]|nr:copper homeostasis protein CutC [Bacteroidia bacterium]
MIEICVDSFESALAAQNAGADRVELCCSLIEGGLTPPLSLVQMVCSKLAIPVRIMLRPRGGDFLYSDEEFEMMMMDVEHFQNAGASGFVFGILNEDGSIDSIRCKAIISKINTNQITFHRAFDMTSDPFLAMEEIIALGADTILTSGLRQTAEDGFELIKELVKRSAQRIDIMAGSGVNASNVRLLHEAGVRTFHFTSRKKVDGKMKYRNEALQSIGSQYLYNEYDYFVFDEDKIESVIKTLGSL